MYNSLQYSLKIWLTASLVVPNVYSLYYLVTSSGGGYFPIRSYAELLLSCVLISMPVWFLFMLLLDMICKTPWPVTVKKWLALAMLEVLLLLLFSVIINFFGDRTLTWTSCFDFLVISSCTIAACIFLYQLQPVNTQKRKLFF